MSSIQDLLTLNSFFHILAKLSVIEKAELFSVEWYAIEGCDVE